MYIVLYLRLSKQKYTIGLPQFQEKQNQPTTSHQQLTTLDSEVTQQTTTRTCIYHLSPSYNLKQSLLIHVTRLGLLKETDS